MNHSIDFVRRLFSLLLLVPLFFGLIMPSQAAQASEGGWAEKIELTGDYTGTFTLNSNTSEIFRAEDAVPGNSWRGSITIKNKAKQPMEAALLTITSNLEDLVVYNALSLDICVGDMCLYSAGYGDTPDQIMPFYVIPAGKSLVLDVTIGLPETIGNEIMGKDMDSTWTFEARYPGESSDHSMVPYTVSYIYQKTGEPLLKDKLSYGTIGSKVTEKALDIKGYQPDAGEKSITLAMDNNLITFVYEKSEASARPDSLGRETPSSVKTGQDLDVSNSSPIIYGILGVLCLLAGIVTYLRMLFAINRNNPEERG